jgi:DNA ligase (NAD+)
MENAMSFNLKSLMTLLKKPSEELTDSDIETLINYRGECEESFYRGNPSIPNSMFDQMNQILSDRNLPRGTDWRVLMEIFRKGSNVVEDELADLASMYTKKPKKAQAIQSVETEEEDDFIKAVKLKQQSKQVSRKERKVKHQSNQFMCTLLNLKLGDVDKWVKDSFSKLKVNKASLDMSLKQDGNSGNLILDSSHTLIQAITRGDGTYGMPFLDVIHSMELTSLDLPPKWKDETVEIKVEVVVPWKLFNQAVEKDGLAYQNPRSMVGGIVSSDDYAKLSKYLRFVPLDVKSKGMKRSDAVELIELLPTINPLFIEQEIVVLDANNYDNVDEMINMIKEFHDYALDKKFSFDTMIDGIVLSFYDQKFIDILDYADTSGLPIPNFSKALKFPDEEALTTIKRVEYDFGYNSGRITPCAVFEPVIMKGNTYQRVQLFNFKRFRDLKLGKNTTVMFSLLDECLGYIAPLDIEENQAITPFKEIDHCPLCNSKLVKPINRKGEQIYAYCKNEKCEGNIIGTFLSLFEGFNINGISVSTIEAIVKSGIHSFEEFMKIDFNKAKEFEGFADTKADNLLNAIAKFSNRFDYEIIHALKLEGIGKEKAKAILKHVSMTELLEQENMRSFLLDLNIPKIKENSIDSFLKMFESEEMLTILDYFYTNLNVREIKYFKQSSLKFVITGSVNFEGNRSGLINYLEEKGHTVLSSISKEVNYLVCNTDDSASNKTRKANSLGVSVISEKELLDMIESSSLEE